MIEDIRVESGASIGSIYHQFASKDEILAHLYSRAVSAYRAGLTASLRDHDEPHDGHPGRRATSTCEWIDSHRALARIMLHWDESELSEAGRAMLAEETRRFSIELDQWLKEAAGAGTIRSMPHELSAALFLGPLLEYGRRMVLNVTRRPLEEGMRGAGRPGSGVPCAA